MERKRLRRQEPMKREITPSRSVGSGVLLGSFFRACRTALGAGNPSQRTSGASEENPMDFLSTCEKTLVRFVRRSPIRPYPSWLQLRLLRLRVRTESDMRLGHSHARSAPMVLKRLAHLLLVVATECGPPLARIVSWSSSFFVMPNVKDEPRPLGGVGSGASLDSDLKK